MIFFVHRSKKVSNNEENSFSLNYEFDVPRLKSFNKILREQNFAYSSDSNKKYIAVISYKSNKASVKQYLIEQNSTLDFTISKDSKLIISIPENRAIDYCWDVKSKTNNGVMEFGHVVLTEIPVPNSEKKLYSRSNFFFKIEGLGNEKLVMRYAQLPDRKPPYDTERNELLTVTFNINAE